MNRDARRTLKKSAENFEARKTFTKEEVVAMNLAAYNLGAEHALEALAIVYGLGEKRLERIRTKMMLLQELDFGQAVDEAKKQINVPRVRLNREQRRSAEPTKGGVLFGEK